MHVGFMVVFLSSCFYSIGVFPVLCFLCFMLKCLYSNNNCISLSIYNKEESEVNRSPSPFFSLHLSIRLNSIMLYWHDCI